MAGIYLHIPFCRRKCRYCNFFSVASLNDQPEMVNAMIKELELQQHYLDGKTVTTLYFGGGTPSLLDEKEITSLLQAIYRYFPLSPEPEITLEANPDNITADKLRQWKAIGINRLSIGIQSFFDEDLDYLGRIHDGNQAIDAIKMAQDYDFGNLSLDLIYGIPTLTEKNWETNLETVFNLGVHHISAYALTIEEKTPLDMQIRRGKLLAVDEQQSILHFKLMMDLMRRNGYEHYEISNFCHPGWYSRHNTAYWQGEHYLGIGPSAHSFNGSSRHWNTAAIGGYLKNILSGNLSFEMETLTPAQQYNEYVMTSLRTMWGCNIRQVYDRFGKDYGDYLLKESKKFMDNSMLCHTDGILILTDKGKLFADRIASELFRV